MNELDPYGAEYDRLFDGMDHEQLWNVVMSTEREYERAQGRWEDARDRHRSLTPDESSGLDWRASKDSYDAMLSTAAEANEAGRMVSAANRALRKFAESAAAQIRAAGDE
jgi:hypothetical protein